MGSRAAGEPGRPLAWEPESSEWTRKIITTPSPRSSLSFEETGSHHLRVANDSDRLIGGAVVVALGRGAAGIDHPPTDAHVLERGESLDIIGPDPSLPTTFTAMRGGVRLDQVGGLDAVFVRTDFPAPLRDGDLFKLGNTVVRYEAPSPGSRGCGQLVRLRVDGWPLDRCPVDGLGATIGSYEAGLTIADDPLCSPHHCRVVSDPLGTYLEDLDSAFGTYRSARPGELLPYGAMLRLGEQVVRIDPV